MKAKIKDKLAILAITGVLAVTLTACNGYLCVRLPVWVLLSIW